MNYFKLTVICAFFFVTFCACGQQYSDAEKIEKLVAACVEKALATSVNIIEYDTVSKKVQEGDGFSGVVVSAQGHILTVSHAAAPNQIYLITFPNGDTHVAKGLGRIGIQNDDIDLDMAMIKILKPGKWPFAQIAPSKELSVNQPVVSISYPSSFNKLMPNVRLGKITEVDSSGAFMESTAKMEPGDSGGPLFDVLGRVVGIHSWIKESEDQNYDVKADYFLKYWTALNVANDYDQVPGTDPLPATEAQTNLPSIPDLKSLGKVSSRNLNSTLMVSSRRGAEQLSILGTVIQFDGPDLKGKILIISKSSMVGDHPQTIVEGKLVDAAVISRNRSNDLVLLKVAGKLTNGINLKFDDKELDLKQKDLGRILISVLGKGTQKEGILSATYTGIPTKSSFGSIGAEASYIDEKIIITEINSNSSASSLLKLKDQLTGINGVPIQKPADYTAELTKYLAGDSISVDVIRDGNPLQFKLRLSRYPTVKHVSFEFAGGRSMRSDGFRKILIQDAAIRADECGGPVFGINGEFYGINVARHSRTSSIIMPADILALFINDALKSNKSIGPLK